MSLRIFSPGESARLPGPVLVELIDLLFDSALLSIVMVGILVICSGLLIFATGGSRLVPLLAGIGGFVSLLRLFDNLAYRRQRPCTAKVAAYWERRYAIGSVAFAVLLGLLNLRALSTDNLYAPMLIGGLFFSYAAGLIMRIYVRPLISGASLLLVAIPTALGYGLLSLQGDAYVDIIFATQIVLIAGFTAIGFVTIAQSYRTILNQLLTKRDLAAMAGQDPLTNLPNRILLRARFDEVMAANQRSGQLVAFHCMDLDRFKSVNDTFGHPTGDALLQAVGNRLARAVSSADTVARIGGDEFVILQAGIRDAADAEALAERIIRVVSAPYEIEGRQISVGISVGVALAPRDGADLEQLLARADAALYQTKGGQRGTVGFWLTTSRAPPSTEPAQGLPVPPVAP